eukprot:Gregarina_sp_Poly_1__4363@NODE_2360_length_2238_cov_52_156610_g1503_i0_p3_GENE_NODE_2360_length_2238_cov_52_156610_g1503_i0NODE_2360_length_2238_cov_52_156610_g1503_i0_p3_ORF_typecomplete_len111_score7_42FUN14/PF04930_15/4_3e03FUN14/PF04930_15/0_00019_NODE_2360_length_2238_cov_52_156610_g1503_i078410
MERADSAMGRLMSDVKRTLSRLSQNRSPPGDLDSASRDTSEAIRDAHQRYIRYGNQLRHIRSVDELIDLNRQEFGTSLGGTEHFVTGTIFGYCSGFAVRKVSRAAALLCG